MGDNGGLGGILVFLNKDGTNGGGAILSDSDGLKIGLYDSNRNYMLKTLYWDGSSDGKYYLRGK
jgi:hypothetical protein